MPINDVNPDELDAAFHYDVAEPAPEVTGPEPSEVIAAAWQRENSMSSAIAYFQGAPGPLTEDERNKFVRGEFNPLDITKGTPWDHPDHISSIAKARSQRELDWIIGNLTRLKRNDETLANASTGAVLSASMAAGVLDPVMAPTLAVPAIRGGTVTRVVGTSATGAAMATASEAMLHATQPQRTLSESMMNVGAGAMFGALLGPLGPRMSPEQVQKAIADIDHEMRTIPLFTGDSVGAAKVEQNLPEGFMDEMRAKVDSGELSEEQASRAIRDKRVDWLKLKNEPLLKVFAFGSPVLRVGTSRSYKAREVLEQLIEDSFIRTKNEFGHTSGPATETIIKGHVDVAVTDIHRILNEEYANYVGTTSKVGQVVSRVKDRDVLSFDEFSDMVGMAQRNADESDIAEVAAAAGRIRKDIDAPLEEILVREKIIKAVETEDGWVAKVPVGDKSYFPRVYNFEKILNDRAGFKKAIINAIRSKITDPEDMAKFDEALPTLNRHLNDTVDKITSSPHGFYDKEFVPASGFFKKRELGVSSDDLAEYLVNDIRSVKESYLREVVPQLELQKRFSGIDLEDELRAIEKEYDQLIEDVGPGKKSAKLVKERDRVVRDIKAMRDVILHRYKRPEDPTSVFHKAGRFVRAHNFITSLGGMTVASIPDVGQTIARIGFKPFAKGLGKLALMPKSYNISRKQAKRMGAGLDAALNNRAASLMTLEDNYSSVHRFDRNIDKAVRGFSKATGMTYWNSSLKQFAGTIYMDDLGSMIEKGLTKRQMTEMAAAGIDKDMWTRIQAQWKEHGSVDEGFRSPNVDDWTDAEARQALSGAVLKEVDTSVVTPGAGDLPLFSRSDVGKVISQFKTFIFTAHNRIFLAGTQRMGFDQFMGMMTMLSLGSAAYGMKEWAAGREPNTNWETLVREGLDKSGYFGYLSDINALTEKATRGTLGLRAALGGEPLSRYASKSVIHDLLGPTAGKSGDYVTALGTVSALLTGGEISESDVKAMRRLIPYQNLIYIRRFLNDLQDAAVQEAQ
jgi:hypothetical protein